MPFQFPPLDWDDVTPLYGWYSELIGTFVTLFSFGYNWWPDVIAFQLDIEEMPF
jgi:hypothetical protein